MYIFSKSEILYKVCTYFFYKAILLNAFFLFVNIALTVGERGRICIE